MCGVHDKVNKVRKRWKWPFSTYRPYSALIDFLPAKVDFTGEKDSIQLPLSGEPE